MTSTREQASRASTRIPVPTGLSDAIPWDRIRSEEIIIGPNEDPWAVANDADEFAGRGEKLIVPVG
jgi:hypothetical protein